jgi:hypothetical protein
MSAVFRGRFFSEETSLENQTRNTLKSPTDKKGEKTTISDMTPLSSTWKVPVSTVRMRRSEVHRKAL